MVKAAVQGIAPGAEVILYGSRARGDAGSDSDWDFLILVEGEVSKDLEIKLRSNLYEIELESGELFSLLLYSRSEWHRRVNTPLFANVETQGLLV